jgi:hypothetical protein
MMRRSSAGRVERRSWSRVELSWGERDGRGRAALRGISRRYSRNHSDGGETCRHESGVLSSLLEDTALRKKVLG